jgi:hypothetical protein
LHCACADEEGSALHALLFPSGAARTTAGLSFASIVGCLREVSAGEGTKFVSLGCARAGLAARIAFDFGAVVVASLDLRTDEVRKDEHPYLEIVTH